MKTIDFRALFQALPGPYMVLDRELRYVEVNPAYEAAVFRDRDELIDGYIFDLFPDAENGERLRGSLQRVLDTGEPDTLAFIPYDVTREGRIERRYWSAVHTPLRDETGEVAFVVQHTVDVTERVRSDAQRKLLLDELNHRVKNTLAAVQSVAAQTLNHTDDMPQARDLFIERLMSLSSTHNLLVKHQWEGAHFRELIDATLAPYGRPYDYVGPDLRLDANLAVSLGMAVHELATNALKHGAWRSEGRIDIAVAETADGDLDIVWRESGGPAVQTPTRRGFGSRLLERGIAAELRGEVKLDFAPAGLICTIRAPRTARAVVLQAA